MELGESWNIAMIAFGIVSGAINFIVGALNSMMKKTSWYDTAWYARLQPWIPGLIGLVPGLLVGPAVVPVELPTTVHAAAGILLGALSSKTYKIWEQSLKGKDARIELARAKKEEPESKLPG